MDERIAVLAAALQVEEPKGLEYHLARCFERRGRGADRQHALEHAKRAVGAHAPAEAWHLLIRLEGEIRGPKAAVQVLREAERFVPPTQNLFSLYQAAGDILARQDKLDDAVALLKEGIEKIPPTQSLGSLYQAAGDILARQGKLDDTVTLLKEGIEKIPPTQSLVSLYQAAGAALARQGKIEAAIDLLCEGIRRVPVRVNGYKLSESALLVAAASRRRDLLEKVIALSTEPQTFVGAALSKMLDNYS